MILGLLPVKAHVLSHKMTEYELSCGCTWDRLSVLCINKSISFVRAAVNEPAVRTVEGLSAHPFWGPIPRSRAAGLRFRSTLSLLGNPPALCGTSGSSTPWSALNVVIPLNVSRLMVSGHLPLEFN